jgi:type VI secretion system protein ImpM
MAMVGEPRRRQTGYFGRLPVAGSLIVRGLPGGFVEAWDRWVTRHLAIPMASDAADTLPAIRFLYGSAPGPMAGIVLPSLDRTGRRFPLTLAATPPPGAGIRLASDPWFDAAEALGRSAAAGALEPDDLARQLEGLEDFAPDAGGPPVSGTIPALSLWTTAEPEPVPTAPEMPGPVIDRLLIRPAGRG